MPDIFTLYEQFIADHANGADPDALSYISRAGVLGDELAILIADYLDAAPPVDSEGARRRAAALVQAAWVPGASPSTLADRPKPPIARGSEERSGDTPLARLTAWLRRADLGLVGALADTGSDEERPIVRLTSPGGLVVGLRADWDELAIELNAVPPGVVLVRVTLQSRAEEPSATEPIRLWIPVVEGARRNHGSVKFRGRFPDGDEWAIEAAPFDRIDELKQALGGEVSLSIAGANAITASRWRELAGEVPASSEAGQELRASFGF